MRAAIARVWERFFFTGGSPDNLGVQRIVIGLALLPFHVLQFASFFEIDPRGVGFSYTDPIWYFEILGVGRLSPELAWAGFALLMLATLAFAAGFHTRTAIALMLVCIFMLKGMRDSISGDVHHRYLMPTHLLVFFLLSRCGDVLSLDARRAARRGAPPPPTQEWEASWPVKATQLYICSFYLWSAIAKLRMSGLSWASGDRIRDLLIERATRFEGEGLARAASDLALALAQQAWLCDLLGAATYLFELGFPLILFIRSVRLRLLFFAGVTFFHVANFVLISVKFLFLPLIFPVFFDLSGLARRWRARRERPRALSSSPSGRARTPFRGPGAHREDR